MTTPIKTSHGIAILTGCLLVAIALIAWSSREIARSTSLSILVNPRSQTANVSDFDNELVGHWTFDEGSGTTANDSSNNGNTGALTSSSMWTTQAAVGSGALQFDGSSSKVTLSNQTLHGGTETWSAWVYMPNVSTGGTILYKSDNDSSDGWMLYIDTSAELWLRLSTVNCSGSDFYAHSSSAAVTSNQWYLVTATWNGALNSNSDITLYVNGNPVSSTGTSCPGATHNDSQSYTPYIGYGGSGAAGYFTGSIDDVRVYNQALSASQIQQLYALGAGGGTPPSSPTTYTLSTTASGQGTVTSSPSGINCGTTCSASFNTGTSVTLSATPASGYTFSGWSGGGCSGIGTCNVSSVSSVTATFTSTSQPSTPGQTTGARTFYIDYASGNDANNGASKTTPWQRAPGMNGFTGNYAHQAGDQFIFKGGVTWPAAAFQFHISNSGTSGNPDYYGVDKTWYAGSSWTRPVFDLARTAIALSSSLPAAVYITGSYVTLDDIEIKNLLVPNSANWNAYGVGSVTTDSSGSNRTIENSYIHDWFPGITAGISGSGSDGDFGGIFFQGSNETADNNTIGPGLPPAGYSGVSGNCIRNGTIIKNNDLTGCADMYIGGASQISGNNFHDSINSYDPQDHDNAIWHNNYYSGQTTYIFDNRISNMDTRYQTMLLHPSWIGVTGTKYYIYNNVYWNVQAPIYIDEFGILVQNSDTHAYMYNNTCDQSFCLGAVDRDQSYHVTSIEAENNHWISDFWDVNPFCTPLSKGVTDTAACPGTPNTIVDVNNLTESTASATSQGYVLANKFAPTSASGATVGAGLNLSSLCGSLPGFCSDIRGNPRPTTGPWDIGAYQYSSTPIADTQAPKIPTGLATTSVTSSSVSLSWPASSDNVAVAGYKIYRNGTYLASVTSGTTYIDSSVSASTQYSYAVLAYDTSNNPSAQSFSISVTTPASSSSPVSPTPVTPTTPTVSNTGGGSIIQTLTISNISSTPVGLTSITISWTTSLPATSQVLYGLTSVYGSQTAASSSLVTVHSVAISNLQQNTGYHFKVLSTASGTNAPSSDMIFTTGVASTPTLTTTICPAGLTCTPTTAPSTISTPMTEFLSLGSSDAQVLALQKFLVSSGYLKATPTGYYGTLTQAAVESFQSAYNIPTVGTVGPLTRAAINSLAGNKVSTSTTQSTTTSIPIIQTPIISGTFSRSLTLGSTGTDVKNLQIFLNTHGFTVSSTGNGSRGYETTYFGLATKAALVKFQEAHASAILTPLGLTHGTGNFGQSTMKVVNNLK